MMQLEETQCAWYSCDLESYGNPSPTVSDDAYDYALPMYGHGKEKITLFRLQADINSDTCVRESCVSNNAPFKQVVYF